MRRQTYQIFMSAILCSIAAPAITVFAAGPVKDLTGKTPSVSELASALALSEAPPRARDGNRSVTPVPDCTAQRQAARRAADRGLNQIGAKAPVAITVKFASGSSQLTPDDEGVLNNLGEAFASPRLAPACFAIQGYTDSVGKDSYNQRLSKRRAQAVVEYLSGASHIDRDRMIAQGFGKSDPIASNDSASGRAKNRRVQIVNLGYGDP